MRIMTSLVEQKAKAGFNMEDFAMKMRNYFYAAAAIVLAASCVKENPMQDKGQIEVNYVPMEFTSAVETKTELSDGKVKWLAGDQISIFDNSATAETHNNQFETTGDGSFSGTVPEDASEFYALYPYRAASTLTDGVISAFLSAEQKAVVGSFADDLAVMVAKTSDGTLAFKNVCSHIKFTLAEDLTDVKSITLMGNKAEILAGAFSINWNEGNPSIEYPLTTGDNPVPDKTGAQTYVTLRNEDGSALVPGDYYFTVLPVTFSDGFTVILSKTDGSQIAKKTTVANDKIASRNKILVMKPLASTEYAEHLNYFVKYNDGFDLTFGGVTINKTTHPGGILASDNKTGSYNTATTSNPDGVYFIDPNCTSAKFLNSVAQSLKVIIGADASVRSTFKFNKAVRFTDGGKLMLMANLDCTVLNDSDSKCIAFDQHNQALFESFDNVVLSNCHFRKVGNANGFFQFAKQKINNINICIEDCEFGISNATLYLVNSGTYESVIDLSLKNNIFYEDGTNVTDFKLFNSYSSSKGATANNLDIQNNTFVKTVVKGTGFAYLNSMSGNIVVKNNYFVETQPDETTLVYLLKPAELADGVTCEIVSNFYYTSISTRAITLDKKVFASPITFAAPKAISGSPIGTSWKPAEGIFGPYESVTYDNNGTATEVPSGVGAQRPDMSATPGSASYRFPSVDLGTF